MKNDIKTTYSELKSIVSSSSSKENKQMVYFTDLKQLYNVLKKNVLHQLISLQKIAVKLDNETKVYFIPNNLHSDEAIG